MSVMRAPWTEAHRREALRRTYELASEVALRGDHLQFAANIWTRDASAACKSEAAWRLKLDLGILEAGRIDREVRRVRALAERRLVRETTWRVTNADVIVWEGSYKPGPPVTTGRHVARVTRIRRSR